MRKTHEVQGVSAIVSELYERDTVIGLDNRADRSGGPASGTGEQLDDIERAMSRSSHHKRLWQPITGCPPM